MLASRGWRVACVMAFGHCRCRLFVFVIFSCFAHEKGFERRPEVCNREMDHYDVTWYISTCHSGFVYCTKSFSLRFVSVLLERTFSTLRYYFFCLRSALCCIMHAVFTTLAYMCVWRSLDVSSAHCMPSSHSNPFQ